MPKTHPIEMRNRAVALAVEGKNSYEIARILGVAQGTAYRWMHPDRNRAYIRNKMTGTCPVCGGPMREGAKSCRGCVTYNAQENLLRDEIIRRVHEGQSHWPIAMALGLSEDQVKWRIEDYRKRGVLPRVM